MAARSLPYAVAPTRGRNFVAHSSDHLPMKSTPINPDWIVDGNPQARTAEHSRGHDDASLTAIWDCTAGEFRWFFGWDETVMILEGEVHVTAEDGTERTLRAGDVAFFAGGTWANWRVDNYVRKVAFLRKPFPRPVAILYRLRNLLRSSGQQGLAA
ncbi:cupin domain-containing protein [Rhizobium gallicum]|uniref:Cupin 2 domain-containing protein n=3 Tax=Rhizobium/Agrobacterium group TaxID=227290 RepID=A0A0B4WZF2_9HYPH|nr:cupin 2 domain-containing protein [Rhizobium gallicum bv. gallicum R602sp]APO66025.1 cupin domain-containing protein [Rhizobium gallicum]